jgi:hypothetical protein
VYNNSSVYNSRVDNSSVYNYILTSIWNKYGGNIVPEKNGQVKIRIGCEVHTVKEWDKHGAAYARGAGEAEWWEESGKPMCEFLKDERKRYMAEHPETKEEDKS